ncbi:hypothetical protein [Qaidamihabitans albus]|nr:hypothetical protein [Qaidamihabitans albus]
MKSVEYGSIEREIHVDASPEVEATPGAVGELVWGDRAKVVRSPW